MSIAKKVIGKELHRDDLINQMGAFSAHVRDKLKALHEVDVEPKKK